MQQVIDGTRATTQSLLEHGDIAPLELAPERPMKEPLNRLCRTWSTIAVGCSLVCVTLACTPTGWKPKEEATQDWQRWTSRARGLEFKELVDFRYIGVRQIPTKMRSMQGGPQDDEEIRETMDAFAAAGLTPWLGEEAVETMKNLYIIPAGVYVPEERRLYVVQGVHRDESGLRSTVMHELVHALQHQHFPQLMEEKRHRIGNLDVAMALRALIEGDATFTMLAADPDDPFEHSVDGAHQYQALNRPTPWEARAIEEPEQTSVDPVRQFMEMLPVGDEVLANVAAARKWTSDEFLTGDEPKMVFAQIMQLAPYAHGILFASRTHEKAGNAGIDAWLEDPPLATLQVRFPDLEHEPIDFIRFPEEKLNDALRKAGCEEGASGGVGTLGLDALLFEHSPSGDDPDLIKAWRGDRLLHAYCTNASSEEKRWEFVWMTRWRDEESAQRFAQRYRAISLELAATRPLSGPASAHVRGNSVVLLTPSLQPLELALWQKTETRTYSRFNEWLAEGCFGDSSCPGQEPDETQ